LIAINCSKSSGNYFRRSMKFSLLIIKSVVNSFDRTDEHLGKPVKKLSSPKLSPCRKVINGVCSFVKNTNKKFEFFSYYFSFLCFFKLFFGNKVIATCLRSSIRCVNEELNWSFLDKKYRTIIDISLATDYFFRRAAVLPNQRNHPLLNPCTEVFPENGWLFQDNFVSFN